MKKSHRIGSVPWSLIHDDWSDLTVDQIAEILCVQPSTVHYAIVSLRKEGIDVPYTKKKRGRQRDIFE